MEIMTLFGLDSYSFVEFASFLAMLETISVGQEVVVAYSSINQNEMPINKWFNLKINGKLPSVE